MILQSDVVCEKPCLTRAYGSTRDLATNGTAQLGKSAVLVTVCEKLRWGEPLPLYCVIGVIDARAFAFRGV